MAGLRNICLSVLVCLGILPNAAVSAQKFWELPPRTSKIDKGNALVLAKGGVPLCEVVVENDATPTAKAAARRLADYLGKVIGGKVEILPAPGGNGKVALIVGDGKLTRELGIDVSSLVRDGFIIRSFGKDKIVIAGRDDPKCVPGTRRVPFGDTWERATLFGVITFLRSFAGVEYFFPGEIGTVVPRNPDLSVPSMDVFDRPDSLLRSVYSFGKLDGKPFDGYAVRPENHSLRLQTRRVPCVHGLLRLKYSERFKDTHPEYFALTPDGRRMNDGSRTQLCWSSGIVEEIYQDAKAWLTGSSPTFIRGTKMRWDPHVVPGFFDVMPNDGMSLCTCEKCKAFQDAGGKYNQLVWKYTCEWAERLKKEGVPGYLCQMSYGNHEIPAGMKVPDNVLVMTAILGPWYYAPGNGLPEEVARVRNMAQCANGKVWYWVYTLKRTSRMIEGVPHSTPRMLGRLYKELLPFTYGVFLENETDEYMFMFLHNYLTAEIFWDMSLDPDKVLDRAYEKMFGRESAPFMDRFFRIQEEIWAEKILNNRRMGPLGPEFDVAGANKLWSEIYSEKCITELSSLLSQAEAKARSHKDNLARIRYIRRCFLDTVIAARQKFLGEQQSVAEFNLGIPTPEAPLSLDGSLEDKAWAKGAEIWLKALKKDVIEVSTRVRLLQDNDYLYMAVEAEEPAMDAVRRDFTQDGESGIWADEVLELFFAAPDRKSYRQIVINTLGKKTGFTGEVNGGKARATGVWTTKTVAVEGKNAQGWTLEIRIPWSELPCGEDGSIIANVARTRQHRPSNPSVMLYTWSPFVKLYSDTLGFGRWQRGKADTKNILGQNGIFQVTQKGRWFGTWGTTDKSVKSGNVALDDRIFLFGGRSLRVKCDGASSSESVTVWPALKPATRYRISWWVRTEGMGKDGTKGSVFPQVYNGKQNVSFPGKSVSSDMPWTRLSGEFVTAPAVPDKKPVMYIRLYNYKSSGTAWFDGVEVIELGPAGK